MKIARFLLLAASLTTPAAVSAQAVTPVAHLDLKQLTGTWYEVARLPDKKQKHCLRDELVLFALDDKPKHFQLVTSCTAKGGYTDSRNQSGKMLGKASDGQLRVGYIFPFTTRYTVLALDGNAQWAMVGSPNHKSLWLLSRSAVLAPDTMTQLLAQAASEGFATVKVVTHQQTH